MGATGAPSRFSRPAWPTSRPSAPPSGPAFRRPGRFERLQPRTVRAKVVSVLMLPVIALMALWGRRPSPSSATPSPSARSRWSTDRSADRWTGRRRRSSSNATRRCGSSALRRLRPPDPPPRPGRRLRRPRPRVPEAATDAAVSAFESGLRSASVETTALPALQGGINTLLNDLGGLRGLRDRVAAGHPATDAYAAYTTAIDDVRVVEDALATVRSGHTASPRPSRRPGSDCSPSSSAS